MFFILLSIVLRIWWTGVILLLSLSCSVMSVVGGKQTFLRDAKTLLLRADRRSTPVFVTARKTGRLFRRSEWVPPSTTYSAPWIATARSEAAIGDEIGNLMRSAARPIGITQAVEDGLPDVLECASIGPKRGLRAGIRSRGPRQ